METDVDEHANKEGGTSFFQTQIFLLLPRGSHLHISWFVVKCRPALSAPSSPPLSLSFSFFLSPFVTPRGAVALKMSGKFRFDVLQAAYHRQESDISSSEYNFVILVFKNVYTMYLW